MPGGTASNIVAYIARGDMVGGLVVGGSEVRSLQHPTVGRKWAVTCIGVLHLLETAPPPVCGSWEV